MSAPAQARTPLPDIEQIGRAMFRRQVASYDVIAAAADLEWETNGDIREFWVAEATYVVGLLHPWLEGCHGRQPAA